MTHFECNECTNDFRSLKYNCFFWCLMLLSNSVKKKKICKQKSTATKNNRKLLCLEALCNLEDLKKKCHLKH